MQASHIIASGEAPVRLSPTRVLRLYAAEGTWKSWITDVTEMHGRNIASQVWDAAAKRIVSPPTRIQSHPVKSDKDNEFK